MQMQIVLLLLQHTYVDDVIVANTATEMTRAKGVLEACFKMKDMGQLHYCLGITIEHDEDQQCLCLHQKQYISTLLVKYRMMEAKVASTPADPNAVAILEVKSRGGQSSRMNVGLRQICWHNKEHNGLVYYASIMLAYWVDNIKYKSILSNRTVGVSTLVNYRSIFSNRTVTVKLSRGAMAPLGPP